MKMKNNTYNENENEKQYTSTACDYQFTTSNLSCHMVEVYLIFEPLKGSLEEDER